MYVFVRIPCKGLVSKVGVTVGLCTGCNLFGVKPQSCNRSCFFLIKSGEKKELKNINSSLKLIINL